MLRPRGGGITRSYSGSGNAVGGILPSARPPRRRPTTSSDSLPSTATTTTKGFLILLRQLTFLLAAVYLGMILQQNLPQSKTTSQLYLSGPTDRTSIPNGFQAIVDRAKQNLHHCQKLGLMHHQEGYHGSNNHTAHLSQFGFLNAAFQYETQAKRRLPSSTNNNNNIPDYPYQCQLPPEHECDETQFTIIIVIHDCFGLNIQSGMISIHQIV